ncbi:hypothetical protein [Nocardia puris]|uniref:Uncharacterized protein n=1 Tax=Nocardia puris TaxID=208602 RepID=A0A366DBX1_9NOCA|nr:hypothetical protein [Nocardia puris]RBO87551.1 hypothetical protein DFR74_111258 [Nocardia puris]
MPSSIHLPCLVHGITVRHSYSNDDDITVVFGKLATAYLERADAHSLLTQLATALGTVPPEPLRDLAEVLHDLEFAGATTVADTIRDALTALGLSLPEYTPALEKSETTPC